VPSRASAGAVPRGRLYASRRGPPGVSTGCRAVVQEAPAGSGGARAGGTWGSETQPRPSAFAGRRGPGPPVNRCYDSGTRASTRLRCPWRFLRTWRGRWWTVAASGGGEAKAEAPPRWRRNGAETTMADGPGRCDQETVCPTWCVDARSRPDWINPFERRGRVTSPDPVDDCPRTRAAGTTQQPGKTRAHNSLPDSAQVSRTKIDMPAPNRCPFMHRCRVPVTVVADSSAALMNRRLTMDKTSAGALSLVRHTHLRARDRQGPISSRRPCTEAADQSRGRVQKCFLH
jgi:hypothetical protein